MKADTVTKDFISDTTVFADVFNYYIYKGRQVIRPEQLEERDSVKIALPYGADGAAVPVQKFRDVQKLCTAMTDGRTGYVLYGTENQAAVHYAMPVKDNLYDALDYAGQVEEAAKSHRRAMKMAKAEGEEASGSDCRAMKMAKAEGKEMPVKEKKRPGSGEFLSGFWKEDRLIPSVTVTIYFGCEEWDGPLSLFDMIETDDPEVLSCMDNYHVRLIAPAQMTDEEIGKFRSSLREVLLFIKYSKDKEGLDRVLRSNEKRFRELERRAADVIQVITNTELGYGEEEGSVDVCQAIRDMREEERLRGEKIGEARGEARGRKLGEAQGRKLGEAQGRKLGEAQAAKRINRLMQRLIQDNRMDDIKRSVNDREYQEKLLEEYGIVS